MSSLNKYDKPILFFDGCCGLCNSLVNFLMAHDHKHRLNFAALQGQTAIILLDIEQSTNLTTLVLYDNGEISSQSTAVLKVISYLGWPWKIIMIAKLLPTQFNNKIYNYISTRRYSWFGKSDTCRLPTSAEKLFFLP